MGHGNRTKGSEMAERPRPAQPGHGRRRLAGTGGLLASLLVGVALMVPVGTAGAVGAAPARAAASLFPATGYFHTAEYKGHWYFVTPQGAPFYSSGIDTVSPVGDTDIKTGQCLYCRAVAADYPNVAAWSTTALTRLRSWGFNTIGDYSDTSLLGSQMPHTVGLSMASGSDWFAPSFVTHADQVAAAQAAPLADDPNVIGYFTDSELDWGPPQGNPQTATDLDQYLALPAGSPGLAVAQQYVGNPAGFLTALATRYFQVTSAALKAADPNHLNLGVKAEGQEIQPELLKAAAPYVDVFSLEDYTLKAGYAAGVDIAWPYYLPVQPNLANMEQYLSNKPIMLGEYSSLAAGPATPNTEPGIYLVNPTQQARANSYAGFIAPLYENSPWVIGDQWFEWYDEPQGGRNGSVFDRENNNFGVVNVADQPYPELTGMMATMHSVTADRLLDPATFCDSWVTGSAGLACNASMANTRYPVGIVDSTLPPGKQGTAYSGNVYAGGGTGSYSFSVTSGALPKGLKINRKSGAVTGTPTKPGSSTFTVSLTDSAKSTPSTESFTLTMAPGTPVSVKTTTLAKAKVDAAYTKALAARNGTAPYTWSVSGGALPAGLTLGADGVFSGQPTVAGTFTFTARATDASVPAGTATRALTLVVKP